MTELATSPAEPADLAPYDPRDWVSPEDLNVAPELLGAPLASPKKRLYAIAIDVALVAALSNIGNAWLVAGLGLVALMLLRKPMADSAWRKGGAYFLAAALIGIGAWQFAMGPHELPHRGHQKLADAAEAAEVMSGLKEAGIGAEKAAAIRIAQLEAQLAEAKQPRSFDLKEQIDNWTEDVGLGLTWAIAYFSLLPVWWKGQTVGKKLLGIRIVELTGKPLTVLRAFKRYGGYAAGMATGAFGFAQVFWDPNRQAIEDKTAHTVVIDLRRGKARKLRARPPVAPRAPLDSDEETP